MNNVLCSKCGDNIEVTVRSIALPFVCEDCILAQEFLKNIEPSAERAEVNEPTDPTDLPHETATVENTTLLIEDLEQQLADARQQVSDDTKFLNDYRLEIERLEDHTTELEVENFIKNCETTSLTERIFALEERNRVLGDVIAGTNEILDEANSNLANQKAAYDAVCVHNRILRNRVTYLFEVNDRLKRKADFYWAGRKAQHADLCHLRANWIVRIVEWFQNI